MLHKLIAATLESGGAPLILRSVFFQDSYIIGPSIHLRAYWDSILGYEKKRVALSFGPALLPKLPTFPVNFSTRFHFDLPLV